MSEEQSDGRRGVTRLSFIKAGAGVLAGAAGVGSPWRSRTRAEPRAVEVEPSTGATRASR